MDYQEIIERKKKEKRTRELNCLHKFSLLRREEKTYLEKILIETVKLLPPAFQYPEAVGVCINYKGQEFKTLDYEATSWKLSSRVELYGKQVGAIEVCYRKPHIHDRDLFTEEEKLLLETIAEQISDVIEQIQSKHDLQKSKYQLAITLRSIGDGVIVTDTGGIITSLNPRAEKLTGWTEKEALGHKLQEAFHIVNAKTRHKVFNPVQGVIDTGMAQNLANNTILVARDGTERYIADSAAPMRDYQDKKFGVIMVFSDVTERAKAEDALIYQLGFEKMLADVSSVCASQSSEQLTQSINYALKQIGEFFLIDRSYVFHFSDDGRYISNFYEWCAEGIKAHMDKIKRDPLDTFPWSIGRINNKKHINIPDLDSLPSEAEADKKYYKSQDIQSQLSIPLMKNDIVYGFIGLDVVKKKKEWTENDVMFLKIVADLLSNVYTKNLAEEKIRYLSFHDSLTGIYNRAYLENEMQRLDTERQLPIGIIMADLNGLKMINDSYGHLLGDQMLGQTAELLRCSCRGEDIISRWGGDEFVIFLPQTSEEETKTICQRIDGNCRATYVRGIPLTLALGYAIKKNIKKDLLGILTEAEENMYLDKNTKKMKVKSFYPGLIEIRTP